jgi:choline dehydrogenase-like flavoprotein
MSSQPEYDAIVIGSGMGGLAFASIMAKLRKWRGLGAASTSIHAA